MEKEGNTSNFFSASNDLNCRLFRPNWENSVDQNDPFESALSSMVSSPTASHNTTNNSGENIVLRELIGRLGSICNSGEISPFTTNNNNSSANTSCYSTPLNSPPKLNLMGERGNNNHFLSLPTFSADPAFAERAARFSCFANRNLAGIGPKLDPAKIQPPAVQENWESIRAPEKNFMASRSSTPDNAADSRENSTVSEQIPIPENGGNPRKRKSAPKGKGKDAAVANVSASENSGSSGKRSKSEEEKANQKASKEDSKLPEPPKDYIHVRARRGQATDAHSLAERVWESIILRF